jgi:4-hydroxybenzoate polyprenyltransferase
MGCYAIFIAVWALVGLRLGLGTVYLAGLAAAAAQALWHLRLIRDRSREGCFRAFRANHWVGFAVFAGIVLDFALR